MEKALIKVLRELEIPPHIKGYQFIKDAVELILADVSILQRMTKPGGLYPKIAQKWNVESTVVEAAIRHVVERIKADEATQKRILGAVGHMGNGAFLGALVEYLRLEGVA